jgi:hypothetical protein
MNSTIIKQTEFYTLKKTEEGFVAELNSAALSGVPGLANIEIQDTDEVRVTLRATNIIKESINPTALVTRRIVAIQRRAFQQQLIS